MLNPAAVGSIAGQTRGRMASRNPSAEGVRSFSAGGRRGGRSLSAEARRSGGVLDVTNPATKGNTVSAKGPALPRLIIASTRSQVAPATVPEGDLTAENAEKKIEELLNEKMALHAARLREQQAAQDEADRARRLEEYIQAEVERRFQLLVLENNSVHVTTNSSHTNNSHSTPKLAPAVERLMVSAGGGSAAAGLGGGAAAAQGGAAAAAWG
jgi:hypothetical protein